MRRSKLWMLQYKDLSSKVKLYGAGVDVASGGLGV